jgi:phage terminase large subunit GpA-like protein
MTSASLEWFPEERAALALPEELTCAQWADKYRILSPRTTAAPGPWDTDLVPFAREILDCWTDPYVEQVTFLAGSQVCKTECALNGLAFAIDQAPGPALLVLPTDTDCRKFSADRLQPLVEDTPQLAKHRTGDPDDLKLMSLSLDRMTIYLASANSPSHLASTPIKYLVLDEVDKYRIFSGREASPIKLARERTRTFWDRKVYVACTPTLETGYIWTEYERGSRERFWLPCPRCGTWQTLEFKSIQWPDGSDADAVREQELADYFCAACGEALPDRDKPGMLSAGKWVSDRYQQIDPKTGVVTGALPRTPGLHRSFKLNALYSPWLSWTEIAAEFLSSKDNPQDLMNFCNSWLADAWRERAESPEAAEILSLAWDLPALTCPEWTLALTAGVDMQQRGFFFSVWAWSPTLESALVHYGYIQTWTELWDLLHESRYPVDGRPDLDLPIWRASIDTGGTQTGEDWSRTEEAYSQLRAHGRGRVFGIKGLAVNRSGQKIRHTLLDRMPGKSGKPIAGGLILFLLDSSQLRDDFFWRLGLGTVPCPSCRESVKTRDRTCGGCGSELPAAEQRIHLHQGTGPDFASHVLGVEKRRGRSGAYEWVKVRQHDLLDASIYAHACADPQWAGGVLALRGRSAPRRPAPRPAPFPRRPAMW